MKSLFSHLGGRNVQHSVLSLLCHSSSMYNIGDRVVLVDSDGSLHRLTRGSHSGEVVKGEVVRLNPRYPNSWIDVVWDHNRRGEGWKEGQHTVIEVYKLLPECVFRPFF